MNFPRKTLFILSLGMSSLIACAQKDQSGGSVSTKFTGSTPCDPYIKSMLKIPDASACEFIKWDMTLSKDGSDSGRAVLMVNYGESQPNTNGFKLGGSKISLEGKFVVKNSNLAGSQRKVYHLTAPGIQSELIMVRLDSNIFHFADAGGKFLLGNAGFSYVLNRIKD